MQSHVVHLMQLTACQVEDVEFGGQDCRMQHATWPVLECCLPLIWDKIFSLICLLGLISTGELVSSCLHFGYGGLKLWNLVNACKTEVILLLPLIYLNVLPFLFPYLVVAKNLHRFCLMQFSCLCFIGC